MFKGNNSWIRWQAETPAACPAFFYSEILYAIVTDIHRVGMAVKQDSLYCVSLFGARKQRNTTENLIFSEIRRIEENNSRR